MAGITLMGEKLVWNNNLYFSFNNSNLEIKLLINKFNINLLLDSLYKCDDKLKKLYIKQKAHKNITIDRKQLDKEGFKKDKLKKFSSNIYSDSEDEEN